MRFMGQNILAIVLAAIVIYAIEFVIFALLIPGPQYEHMTGISDAQMTAGMSRMPFGAIMPILAAIGISLVVKWRNAPGLMAGVQTGALLGLVFGFSISMYQYVYGPATEMWLLVSALHFVIAYGVAGAILGAWK